MLTVPEEWAAGVDPARPEAARTMLIEHVGDWDASLRALLAEADDPLTPRPIHVLPVGHRWDHVRGVTLLGDAALLDRVAAYQEPTAGTP